jgi:hypothetical protein
MTKAILTLFSLLILSSAVHIAAHQKDALLKPGKVNIIADNGKYVVRCEECKDSNIY